MKLFYFTLSLLFLLSGCGDNNSDSIAVDTPYIVDSEIETNNTAVQDSEAAVLYERCQPCHGASAEKHALQYSDIIANYTKKELIDALTGYKNGTRNEHNLGPIMEGQALQLSDYEIVILSDYISRF